MCDNSWLSRRSTPKKLTEISSPCRTPNHFTPILRRMGSYKSPPPHVIDSSPIPLPSPLIENLKVESYLGQGSFGSVYSANVKESKCAVKRFHKHHRNPAAMIKSIRAECIASQLRHPNIIRFYGMFVHRSEMGVLMELFDGQNLASYVAHMGETISTNAAVTMLLQISKALAYLHGRNVAHLDVKPANVLVGHMLTCKLIDFGCSQILNEYGNGKESPTKRSLESGTIAYSAPEQLKCISISSKCDIYSFGVMANEVLTGEIPYHGMHPHIVIFSVGNNEIRPRLPINRPSWMLSLIRSCWDTDPVKRPYAPRVTELLQAELRRCS